MDIRTIDRMIGRGFTLGLHGHQHRAQAAPRSIQLAHQRTMVVVSAGTLCADGDDLPIGTNRQYNVIEISDDMRGGRVHVREMRPGDNFAPCVFQEFGNKSFIEFKWASIESEIPQRITKAIERTQEQTLASFSTETFQNRVLKIIDAAKQGVSATALKKEVQKELQTLNKEIASKSREIRFIKVDLRPLVGKHRSDAVISLPYDALEFVGDLTNEVYFGANRYRAVLDPYTYAKKWVLRDKASRSTYDAMGRTWAARQGKERDDRSLEDVGIKPGMTLEAVPIAAPEQRKGPTAPRRGLRKAEPRRR